MFCLRKAILCSCRWVVVVGFEAEPDNGPRADGLKNIKHIGPDISEIHCTESICEESLKLMLIMMGLKCKYWPASMTLAFQRSAGWLLSGWAVECHRRVNRVIWKHQRLCKEIVLSTRGSAEATTFPHEAHDARAGAQHIVDRRLFVMKDHCMRGR